jgi:hypothetical protein
MDLNKYLRPDGTTYWSVGALDPADKLFVEELQTANVRPKNYIWLAIAVGVGVWYLSRK